MNELILSSPPFYRSFGDDMNNVVVLHADSRERYQLCSEYWFLLEKVSMRMLFSVCVLDVTRAKKFVITKMRMFA